MDQSQKQQRHDHGVKQLQIVEEEEEEEEEEEGGLQLRGRKTQCPTTIVNNKIKESAHFSISSNGQHYNSAPNYSHTDQKEDHEAVPPASVYFDELGGKWQCRHCNWTYCLGIPSSNFTSNLNGHILMDVGNFNQHGRYFVFETKGTNGRCFEVNCDNTISSDFRTNPGDADTLTENFDTQEKLIEEIKHEHGGVLEDDRCSDLSSELYLKRVEEQGAEFKSFDNEAIIDESIDLVEEIDTERTEFDVEKVLAKQSTHDLYCPNCNSCITRRIILRRRKPKVRNPRRKPKHDKAETPFHYQLDPDSLTAANDRDSNRLSTGGNIPAPKNDIPDGEPDVFRCLSCFSIFIPTGNGFKLFRVFGDSTENKNIQNPQKSAEVKTNWFSVFATNQKKTKTEQANDAVVSHYEAKGTNEYNSSCVSGTVTAEHKIDDLPVVTAHDAQTKPHKHVQESRDLSTVEHLHREKMLAGSDKSNLSISSETLSKKGGLLPSALPSNESYCLEGLMNDTKSFDQETGKEVGNLSIEEIEYHKIATVRLENQSNVATENSSRGVAILNQSINDTTRYERQKSDSFTASEIILIDTGKPAEDVSLKPRRSYVDSTSPLNYDSLVLEESNTTARDQQWIQSGQVFTMKDNSSPKQLLSEEGSTKDMSIQPDKANKSALLSFFQGMLILQNFKFGVGLGIGDAAKEKNKGNDLAISVETEQLEPSPRSSRNVVVEDGILLESGARGNFDEQRSTGVGVDILKSIVYGGLIESITSLGVICSAAGAGAATLDILAMTLANLIGGLFIIGHNLIDLKNEGSRGTSSQINQQDDRYQALLGKRDRFSLHVTVVIISYLIFGLLPPIVYGFSFRKSDDKDLKLALVGGASLVCIILLAIGKAYVFQKPYIRNVLYYVIIGFMASGASYIVGDLIRKLMQQVGWFHSSLSLVMPHSETKSNEPPLTSY